MIGNETLLKIYNDSDWVHKSTAWLGQLGGLKEFWQQETKGREIDWIAFVRRELNDSVVFRQNRRWWEAFLKSAKKVELPDPLEL